MGLGSEVGPRGDQQPKERDYFPRRTEQVCFRLRSGRHRTIKEKQGRQRDHSDRHIPSGHKEKEKRVASRKPNFRSQGSVWQ